MSNPRPARLKFIACEIIYREACRLAAMAPGRVDLEFLRKGLHDLETADMTARIQATIDAVEDADHYDAIILGYARCNDGLVGVTARNVPLVIPKAHDCITLFFGSRDAYREYFDAHPGTYYMTTGWTERNNFEDGDYSRPAYDRQGVMGRLGLTESYEQLVEKYGADNAEYIQQTLGDWRRSYTNMLYLEMGVCDEKPFIEQARAEADEHHWAFERRNGDWSLLEKLVFGQWDDDFVIVRPGQRIVARNDDGVLDVEG